MDVKKPSKRIQKIDHMGLPCNRYLVLDYGKL